jgi:hypothetical protein
MSCHLISQHGSFAAFNFAPKPGVGAAEALDYGSVFAFS